jgi:acetyl-CoA carboxylase biotin carboxylase subunit
VTDRVDIDLEELAALVELLRDADFSEFRYENGDVRIVVRRGQVIGTPTDQAPAPPTPAPASPTRARPAPTTAIRAAAPEPGPGETVVTAPLLGTFYGAPKPGEPPFVKVGDRVGPASVLCIVEVMKLMTSVTAGAEGVVAAVHATDGDLVEFGQAAVHPVRGRRLMSTPQVFVANRGEIAVRILDACARLGLRTVLGVSLADRDSLAAQRAERVVVIGGPRPADSYLCAPALVHAAVATGCTAVHPGYGFLSEQPAFARLCEENGLIFVGPRPEHLEALGDKLKARLLAESVGVPVSPGGPTRTAGEASALAAEIGFPVFVKAARGGGGRGMKLVDTPEVLADAWAVASAEAQAAFGDGTVFVERFVGKAKHVEVQVIGDGHGHRVHLGERECSVQYRYQKVVEEAPCSALSQATRERLHAYALRIAGQLEYTSLGTVEFLYDVDRDAVSFLEVNPRVQVEHPVTEAVTGIDIVRAQLLIGLGEPLEVRQDEVAVCGHAIECRLTAQDPEAHLRPTPGLLGRWRPAPLGGIRVDTHLYEGYSFPPYYDALMAKLIAYGADRDGALDRIRAALDRLDVGGITTNRALLQRIVAHPDFAANTVTTHWLNRLLHPEGGSD